MFLSSLVWFFLWVPEEELSLLFLLHCENGDFSILMKDIVKDDRDELLGRLLYFLPSPKWPLARKKHSGECSPS